MEIRFLGTGGAFDVEQGNSAAIVKWNGKHVLIDCGHTVFPRLSRLDLLSEVDTVLVTHLHDDHVGSLSTLILYYNIVLQKGRIRILYPTETFRSQIESFLSHSLGDVAERVEFEMITKEMGIGVIDTHGRHVPGMQTWAYYFFNEKRSILYSGDNGDAEYLLEAFKALKLPEAKVFHELTFYPGIRAHAHYSHLQAYSDDFEIYGYHCNPAMETPDNKIPLVANTPEFLY